MASWWQSTTGDTDQRFGNAVWCAFVSAQAADGVLTYLGMTSFGHAIEANPIVWWYTASFGVTTGLIAAKLLSIACAGILHAKAMHIAVGLLTVLCLLVAVRPWVGLLWQ